MRLVQRLFPILTTIGLLAAAEPPQKQFTAQQRAWWAFQKITNPAPPQVPDNGWVKTPPRYKAKKKICKYFNQHFYLTTSGNFRTQTLIDALLEIGADRILFSADWPFENVDHAAQWFDSATISEADRKKIGRDNALRLFKLDSSQSNKVAQAAE